MTTATAPATTRLVSVPVAAALLAVLLLALVHLPFPLGWDQAVFMMGAERMAQGGALYRDFWDSKQPGIFFFYGLAGRLFGFHEPGLHALELLLGLTFAVVATWSLRASLRHPLALASVPLLAVGWYYVVTSDWHLTQIEALAGLPLFVTLAAPLAGAGDPRRAGRHFLVAGLAGGAVLMLKLVLLPLVGALWSVGLIRLARSAGRRLSWMAVTAIAFGAAVPIVATLLILAHQGAVADALETWFVVPVRALRHITSWNVVAFADSVRWMLIQWAPLLLLALFGVSRALRESRGFGEGLLAWLAAGTTCLAMQRISGWQYQFMLLLPAIGLLAAFGVEDLLDRLEAAPAGRAWRRALPFVAVLALLSLSPLSTFARKVVHLARHDWALTPSGRWGFQVETSLGNVYGRSRASSAFLAAPAARAGPIYVLGNPLVYWVSARRPAVARIGGTMMGEVTAQGWREIALGLERSTPYVFVERGHGRFLDLLRPDSDPMLELLRTRYRPTREDDFGTWYERL